MIEVREAAGEDVAAWERRRQERLRAWYGRFGVSPAWVEAQTREFLLEPATTRAYQIIGHGGTALGHLTLSIGRGDNSTIARIADLYVAPAHRRQGVASAAVAWAVGQVAGLAGGPAVLRTATDPADAASEALFAAWRLQSQTMIKKVGPPPPLPPGVAGRPMTEDEYAQWSLAHIRSYAADLVGSGRSTPQEALDAARRSSAELLPAGLRTPGHTLRLVTAAPDGGEVVPVASVWVHHHNTPDASWVYAVDTGQPFRGRGYGRAAMLAGEQATLEAGDTHLGLNVFGHNHVAINLYTSLGYAIVDRHRSTGPIA